MKKRILAAVIAAMCMTSVAPGYAFAETAPAADVVSAEEKYTFEMVQNMTEDEIKALFAEKGMTEKKGYSVWTKEKVAEVGDEQKIVILLKPDAKFVTADGREIVNESTEIMDIVKSDDDFREQMTYLTDAVGLPKDKVYLAGEYGEIHTEGNDEDGRVRRRYYRFHISYLFTENEELENSDIRNKITADALNYVQLSSYFNSIVIENPISYSSGDPTELKGTKQMTLADVKELAKKGDALDWSDFEEFKGRDVGSGLYIWQFELEKGFFIKVGGVTDKKPDYIELSRKYGKGIDIRTEDIDAYLKAQEAYYLTVTVLGEVKLFTTDYTCWLVRDDNSLYREYKFLSPNDIGSDINVVPGMKLKVNYSGILETFPGQFEDVYEVNVVSEDAGLIKGDSNCDGQVDMADVVFIMQALANPDRYGEKAEEYTGITELGKLNGDMNGDGLTVGDALAIQKKLLGLDETETLLDITRKKISDFIDESKINFTVIPKERIPEKYADKYVFINKNYCTSKERDTFDKFILQNEIDKGLIKYITYDLDDDHKVNKIVEKLYWYILDNDINASVSRFAGSNDPKFEDKVVISYNWREEDVKEKIYAFLEENNVDPELVISGGLE
ncbi:MAG: dockerin type I repeat-containing protein [Ruminococcus sp.]|uniref:dockerin type I repeat-containing protein n=1 Tax=Ruminococcus sp. TaxID=41978 RepID=UPI0025D72F24|nr:dockerin type I repeat-containing protein [Ruminococcus sp.]MCR4795714.1 dockerin type I repeat-containing protein [Ruminococcus sp.]